MPASHAGGTPSSVAMVPYFKYQRCWCAVWSAHVWRNARPSANAARGTTSAANVEQRSAPTSPASTIFVTVRE